ncbi:hypothetical protein PAXRUDRAFT_13888 [Paxillus rubicundulus Ve08.2h10]|uniref:Rieske domain-containing protein n=1 Tax=Paxillus rubicundulus Ve08.2h10 TaxID=930991 RepID=A0A0D0DSN8_9AGAM|nr:hypothetical protein PAXRUDRAFT_13888 [Paxillus rubicundulus Ve08.2h10]
MVVDVPNEGSPDDGYVLVSPYDKEGRYHSLILFRLASTPELVACLQENHAQPLRSYHQLYAMESACPHLGADMSDAEIEECDNSIVAVCPWHRYDFDLRTGESETGLRACTYNVKVVTDRSDGEEKVWVEGPDDGTQWRLVELRPVSEDFADPPPVSTPPTLPNTATTAVQDEPLVPTGRTPSTLMEWAVVILNTANPTLKVERTKHAVQLFRTGRLTSTGHKSKRVPLPPAVPPRDDNYTQNIVDPRKLGKRKNAAVMLHALANIEQWAIDLAWDIMVRFGSSHPNIPQAFFSDFTRMALDESKHFSLLVSRLAAISPSTPYGSLPVHAGLWESATVTSHSLRARLAIIHLVHEARGLDVNPGTIERFRRAGDTETVKVLEIIHADEVTHVTSGHRWFTWVCEQQGVNPVSTFREEVRRGWRGNIKGPFNVEARETAGLSRAFYEDLKGELDFITENTENGRQGSSSSSSPSLQVNYEKD